MFNNKGQAELAPTTKSSPTNATLTIENDSYDFGTISMASGDVTHLYTVKNLSQEAIVLGEIYTSCMCTAAQVLYSDETKSAVGGMRGHNAPTYLNKTIQPGESFEIKATFDPAAHGPSGTGPIHRNIYVQTNSTVLPQIELTFDANVTK